MSIFEELVHGYVGVFYNKNKHLSFVVSLLPAFVLFTISVVSNEVFQWVADWVGFPLSAIIALCVFLLIIFSFLFCLFLVGVSISMYVILMFDDPNQKQEKSETSVSNR